MLAECTRWTRARCGEKLRACETPSGLHARHCSATATSSRPPCVSRAASPLLILSLRAQIIAATTSLNYFGRQKLPARPIFSTVLRGGLSCNADATRMLPLETALPAHVARGGDIFLTRATFSEKRGNGGPRRHFRCDGDCAGAHLMRCAHQAQYYQLLTITLLAPCRMPTVPALAAAPLLLAPAQGRGPEGAPHSAETPGTHISIVKTSTLFAGMSAQGAAAAGDLGRADELPLLPTHLCMASVQAAMTGRGAKVVGWPQHTTSRRSCRTGSSSPCGPRSGTSRASLIRGSRRSRLCDAVHQTAVRDLGAFPLSVFLEEAASASYRLS